jgi:hypothetical protein
VKYYQALITSALLTGSLFFALFELSTFPSAADVENILPVGEPFLPILPQN